tara:strand:+ start:22 stop:222 length:201 start_codon:yes stop_codon:yes gene_type:complete
MPIFLKEFFWTQSKLYKKYSWIRAFVIGIIVVLTITVYSGEFMWLILGGFIFLDLIANYVLLKYYK